MKVINKNFINKKKIIDLFINCKNTINPGVVNFNNIIIFDFHLIGDIVLLLPLLKKIRKKNPNARILLVAGAWSIQILNGSDYVSEIVSFSAPWVKYRQGLRGYWNAIKLIFKLRKDKWDLGIEIRGDVRQILMLWLTGAKRRVGWNFTGGEGLLTDVVPDDGTYRHLAKHNQEILEYLGYWEKNDIYKPHINLTNEEIIYAKSIDKFIGVHIGASLPLKCMPVDEIEKLISKLLNTHSEKMILFIANDFNIEQLKIIGNLSNKYISKLSTWSGSLRGFIVMVSRAKHFYGMDSGPSHIAAALGVPTTVFFGATIPDYVKPIGDKVDIIVKENILCRPCDQRNCTHAVHHYCMLGLDEYL